MLDAEGVLVRGIVVEEGVECWETGGGLAVEGSVEVVKKPVANGNGVAGCCGCQRPAVVFLGDRCIAGVVSHEWVERSQSSPACAECFRSVTCKATDIRTYHGNLENGGKVEDPGDTKAVLFPRADIITKPFSNIASKSDKLRASISMRQLDLGKVLTVDRVMMSGRRSGLRANMDFCEAMDIIEPQKLWVS